MASFQYLAIFLFVFLFGMLIFKWIPRFALMYNFKKAGNMQGMLLSDLVKKVGKYRACEYLPDGQKKILWRDGGYHVTLLVDSDDRVIRILNEIVS